MEGERGNIEKPKENGGFWGREGKILKNLGKMKVFGGEGKENIEKPKENEGCWRGEEGKH